jgi:hypothetical protein
MTGTATDAVANGLMQPAELHRPNPLQTKRLKFMPTALQSEFMIAVASEHLAEPPFKKSRPFCILMETRVAASKMGHVATRALCGAHMARLQSQDALKQSLVQWAALVS